MQNAKTAKSIIKAYVEFFIKEQGLFLTYGDLAIRIGRPGEHNLLGAPLDIARELCKAHNLPDITTMIVNKPSIQNGTMKPSENAIQKYNGWPDLRREQAKVIAFEWSQTQLSID